MEDENAVNGPIRVLLADDHVMFREGLAQMLTSQGGMQVVGEASNDEQAVALAQEKKPDVVIMQIQIPIAQAKARLSEMLRIDPAPKVVIATMFEDPDYVREFTNLGVSAYMVKSSSVEHLLAAIRAAAFDPEGNNVIVGMPREALENAQRGSGGVISGRELEILLLVSRGMSNRQIATSLNVAEATIKRHLANVYRKMNVGSRGEAMRAALWEGWITIRDVTRD